MIWPQQPIRVWLTDAGAGALVPRVVANSEFDAVLWEADRNGLWVEVPGGRRSDLPGQPVRLIRNDFIASVERFVSQEQELQ